MPQLGKINQAFFEDHIAPRLGAARDDLRLGPQSGVDFGVIDIDSMVLAVATDPLSILPPLGFKRAGKFAVRIVLADVAVSGLAPSHLSIAFTLPPELSTSSFGAIWEGIHEECQALGVRIATGHTARYGECSFPWVGGATAMAVGDPSALVYPNGAQPGDRIIVTRGPAVEATGLFATLFPDRLPVDEETVTTAQGRLAEASVVRDARAVAEAGRPTAMHDATEGGLLGALHEMADSAGVQFRITKDAVPFRPGIAALCSALDMDPWTATSSGTLVITAPEAATADILDGLADRDTTAAVVGTVTKGSGVYLDGEATTRPTGDASWPVYERLRRK